MNLNCQRKNWSKKSKKKKRSLLNSKASYTTWKSESKAKKLKRTKESPSLIMTGCANSKECVKSMNRESNLSKKKETTSKSDFKNKKMNSKSLSVKSQWAKSKMAD